MKYIYVCVFVGSLWLLFRGQKTNVLRERVDTCEYSNDQLVLGTLLLTLLFFLFPTILNYYLFFSLLRLISESTQAMLW